MTDKETRVEQRLREALARHAERTVPGAGPVPALPPVPPRRATRPVLLPVLAAAAVVVAIAGGSVWVSQLTGAAPARHPQHSAPPAATDDALPDFTGTGTGTPTTVPPPSSSAAPGTPRRTATPTSAPARSSTPAAPTASARTSAHRVHGVHRAHHTHAVPSTSGAAHRTSAPTAPPVGACPDVTISVGGDREVDDAGRDYTFLEIVDHGAACTLDGFPGITIYDRTGTRVSGAVAHRGDDTGPVHLAAGGSAEFEIYDRYGSAAGPDCEGDVDGSLVVDLPDRTVPVTVDGYWYSACDLSVTAVHTPTPHP